MGLTEILNLCSVVSLEEIARFNSQFVPEKRLSDLKFLEWKYRTRKPNGDDITKHFGILNEKGNIVAQISVQPMEMWVGGEWQQCQYWADWYSDPSYAGVGLKLLFYVMEQKPLMLITSASRLAYTIYEKWRFLLLPIDYRFVFNCRPLTTIVRSIFSPRRAAREFLAWRKNPSGQVAKPSLEPGFQFSEEKSIDPDLLIGWEADIPRDTVFVRREGWVLSWLLDQFPFPEFRLVVLSSRSQQLGYVLLHVRRREHGIVEGKIVDLFARRCNWDYLVALFREGTHRLCELGVNVIHYHATHPTFVSLAQANGFTRVRIQSIIAHGPLAAVLSSGETSLHMTYYDHDEAYY